MYIIIGKFWDGIFFEWKCVWDEFLFDVVEVVGYELLYLCCVGVCGICVVKLEEGSID